VVDSDKGVNGMKRVLVGVGVVVVACAFGAVLVAQDAKLVEQGKKAYETRKCSDCHTIGGKGGRLTKQFPMDGVATKLSAADIRKWFTATAEMEAKVEKPAKLKMTSKKYVFTDAEVDGLVAYMLTLNKK
jgi:mono/diheme cytochrome c family protein